MSLLAYFLYYVLPIRKQIVRTQLAHGLPSIDGKKRKKIHIELYSHLILFLKENIFHSLNLKTARIKESESNKHLLANWNFDTGVIILCLHMGNWEIALPYIARELKKNNKQLHVVRRLNKSHWINNIFYRRAKNANFTIIDKNGALSHIEKALRLNQVVLLPIDQRANSKSGTIVNFFRKKTYFNKVISMFSILDNTPVLPCYTYRDENRSHVIKVQSEIPPICNSDLKSSIQQTTQQYADHIEMIVRQHPEQWFCWFHHFWK